MGTEALVAVVAVVASLLADVVAKMKANRSSVASTASTDAAVATLTANMVQVTSLHQLMQSQLDNHETRLVKLEDDPKIGFIMRVVDRGEEGGGGEGKKDGSDGEGN